TACSRCGGRRHDRAAHHHRHPPARVRRRAGAHRRLRHLRRRRDRPRHRAADPGRGRGPAGLRALGVLRRRLPRRDRRARAQRPPPAGGRLGERPLRARGGARRRGALADAPRAVPARHRVVRVRQRVRLRAAGAAVPRGGVAVVVQPAAPLAGERVTPMLYDLLFRTVLSRVDPERAHHGAARLIALAGRVPPLRGALAATLGRPAPGERPVVFGRRLPGRLGLAAGFDKDATMAAGLAALGFAFVEVGTVTAHPQPGNPRPRLQRVTAQRALVNRMGFNNQGAAAAARRLARLRRTAAGRRLVIGANIGKSKMTPPADAVADYVTSARAVAPYADYLVVNVSSPNTPGLRDLQATEALRPILAAVVEQAAYAAGRDVPVLVKIAPDLADD